MNFSRQYMFDLKVDIYIELRTRSDGYKLENLINDILIMALAHNWSIDQAVDWAYEHFDGYGLSSKGIDDVKSALKIIER